MCHLWTFDSLKCMDYLVCSFKTKPGSTANLFKWRNFPSKTIIMLIGHFLSCTFKMRLSAKPFFSNCFWKIVISLEKFRPEGMFFVMCDSRKYPYPSHGWFFRLDPSTPSEFPIQRGHVWPPHPPGISYFPFHGLNLPYLEIIDRVPLKINCSHLKTHFFI